MCESNNHTAALKLFGTNIPVPEINIPADSQLRAATGLSEEGAKSNNTHLRDPDKQDGASVSGDDKEASKNNVVANRNNVNPWPEGEQENASSCTQEKVVKKPDKILPCPRCNSLDTKFCYFNNYNVNQPRHYCKNCQRYWTAGGTIRNVPVGAGRRKNKLLASQYHQILLSSNSISAERIETSDMVSRQLLLSGKCMMPCIPSVEDSAFLKFGTRAPLCHSMKIMPDVGDPNKCAKGSLVRGEDGEKPHSCGTYVARSSNSSIESNENSQKHQIEGGSCDQFKLMPPLNYYSWNSGWDSGAFMTSIQKQPDQVYVTSSSNSNPVEWCSGPSQAVPGLCGPNLPLVSYKKNIPILSTVGGSASLTASGGCLSPSSSNSNSCCSSNGLPILGKRCQDRNLSEEEKREKYVLLPKTLKIDDQHHTLKNPVWSSTNPAPKSLAEKVPRL